MKLYHYTCPHAAERIRKGGLVLPTMSLKIWPWRPPLVFLTTNPDPTQRDLHGAQGDDLEHPPSGVCDLLAAQFTVTDTRGCIQGDPDSFRDTPDHWVSPEPVPVRLTRLRQEAGSAERCWREPMRELQWGDKFYMVPDAEWPSSVRRPQMQGRAAK